MKKLLIALFVGLPLVACTQEKIVRKTAPETPGETTPGEEAEPTEETEPTETQNPAKPPPSTSTKPEDNCLDGQDLDGADVDIKACHAVPEIPADVKIGKDNYSLGAWEIGTTKTGATYKYGTLSAPTSNPRVLTYEGGETEVNEQNLECWAKGYYRLRKILQNAPPEYLALKKAGFQYRFFQFQTDLRNGPTGYKAISSFQDHLVKWVTVINKQGVCEQPTYKKFQDYAKAELKTRGIAAPTN